MEVFGEPGLVDERLPCTQVEPKFHDNDDDDGDGGDGDDDDSNNDVNDDDWYIKVKTLSESSPRKSRFLAAISAPAGPQEHLIQMLEYILHFSMKFYI